MIKIKHEPSLESQRFWNTRQDLNNDKVYVLTYSDGGSTSWDLYMRADGGCRLVQWDNPVMDGDTIYESSIMVKDLREFLDILQEATELSEGYFDNDSWRA